MNLIRNLTGSENFNFFGFYDGSMVGITYAAIYPEHVGRMVLDSTSYITIADQSRTEFRAVHGCHRERT